MLQKTPKYNWANADIALHPNKAHPAPSDLESFFDVSLNWKNILSKNEPNA